MEAVSSKNLRETPWGLVDFLPLFKCSCRTLESSLWTLAFYSMIFRTHKSANLMLIIPKLTKRRTAMLNTSNKAKETYDFKLRSCHSNCNTFLQMYFSRKGKPNFLQQGLQLIILCNDSDIISGIMFLFEKQNHCSVKYKTSTYFHSGH